MWKGHFCAWVNFFPPIESVSHRQSVEDCVSVVNARRIVNYCKMTERPKQRYCIKFCQKLGDTQVEKLFERFNRLSGTVSHQQKSGTTVSKMAAHQWTANHITVGPQLAEVTMSSTKCELCSCRTVVSLSENWQTRWG